MYRCDRYSPATRNVSIIHSLISHFFFMQRILELLVPGTFKYHKSKIRYPQVKGTLGRASYKITPLQVLGRCGYVRNDHFRVVVYKSIVGTSLTFL